MPNRVKDIIEILENHFPLHLAASWDNCGLQVGSCQASVKRVGVALELEPQVLEQALQQQIDLIITHHPLFFQGIKCLDEETALGDMVYKLVKAGIALYAAHTNLDAAPQGLNQHLAEILNLQDIMPLFMKQQDELYKIVVFVPADYVIKVHEAMSRAGAGHIGKYSSCSFRAPGIGTFRPEAGSRPWIGSTGVLEEVEEYRLETVIHQPGLNQVLQAMQAAHPYEEVAYDVFRLVNGGRIYSMGRKGRLITACSLDELARQVKTVFASENLRVVGDPAQLVERVALISGSGGSMLADISTAQAEVVITGDVKYHEAQEARLRGLTVIDAGHQELERHMIALVQAILQGECQRQNRQVAVIGLETAPCFRHF